MYNLTVHVINDLNCAFSSIISDFEICTEDQELNGNFSIVCANSPLSNQEIPAFVTLRNIKIDS